MKKILVPTDFSENAMSAFLFALDLAPLWQAEVEVVHVFSIPDAQVLAGVQMHQTVEDWMDAFIHQGLKQSGSKGEVKTRLLQGITEGQLIRASESPEVEAIIMGAEGSGGIGKKWFGSVAETVARQSSCPVLLVPEGMTYKGFRHILFASDYTAADPSMLDLLTRFAGLFHASIHFVHVEKPGEGSEYASIEQRIMDYLFRDGTPEFSFQMTCMHAEDVTDGLESYASQNRIDLIAMVATQRTFWETLFRRSQTKEMILKSKIPLVVFHLGD